MKRIIPLLLLAAAAARSSAESPTGIYYSLGIPGAQVLRVGEGVGEGGVWQARNAVYPVMSAIVPKQTSIQVPGERVTVALDSVEAGFAADRAQPQYWLGDRVYPDRAFDTNITFSAWLNDKNLQHQFIMDAEGEVYAVAGGTLKFPWISRGADGLSLVTNEQTYVVAPTSKSRPKRLFWTDPPYNSPGIDLSGKFVKFFGAPEVVDPHYGKPVTNYLGGQVVSVTSNQVRGIRLDSQGTLTVAGTTRGQFVLVYFADGNFRDVHAAQVVEVRQPYVNVMEGEIGKPLLPDGDGWAVEGLQPFPTRPSETDYLGAYFYQHRSSTSYGAKNGNVYPIRPTVGERWNMEIWWKEPDAKGVYWPFECDQYACDWPEDAPVYVRGDDPDDPGASIEIPDDYSVLLMDYQKPLGHAWLDDHTFTSTGPGWSLLKLEAKDDVWFLPVRSVSRSDRTWFKDEAERWPVATEIRPRGTPVDGLAENRWIPVDSEIPGYVYGPRTTGRYNLDTLPEAIFPVNAPQNGQANEVIEVWWSQSWDGFAEDPLLFDDVLPVPVAIPSLPQRYLPVWPEPAAMPEIVIASERGSRQESICRRTGALVYAGADAGADLPTADYFPGGSGSFMLWTRRNEDTTGLNGADKVPRSSLIAFESLPTEDGAYERLEVVSTEDCGIELSHTAYSNILKTVRMPAGTTYTVLLETSTVSRVTCPSVVTNAADWLHVAVVATNGVFEVYQNGRRSKSLSVGPRSALVDAGVMAWLGTSAFVKDSFAAPGTELAEISTWNFALAPGRIDRLARTVLGGDEDGLTSYHSIRPNRDFEATGIPLRLLPDLVTGEKTLAYDCLRRTPGPPAYYEGIYPAGSSPKVYYRNEAGSRGYNPNEEHAFVTDDPDGAYTVWALRTDLNIPQSSPPVVLVEYREDGQWRMRAHRVVVSNEKFHAFAGTGTVGEMIPGPHPFDIRWATSWPSNIYWTVAATDSCGDVPYRDRNGRLWFRAEGKTDVYMYYPLDEGFWIPALADRHPAVGTPVPWLVRLGDPAADILRAAPKPWAWTASWPTNGVPELEIGQTITRNDGTAYPDVWNAASMAVVYPDPTDRGSVDDTVILADPTAARTARIGRSELEACGFKAGQGGNVIQRGSKWFFRGLPPSISDRVWYDTETGELTFVGRMDEDLGMLYLNVLSADERTALKSLVPPNSKWMQAVAAIDQPPLLPNTARWKGWRRGAADPEKADLAVAHGARDHYALTAMGRADWVVLVENDAGKEMVNPLSAVKMHVLKAVRRYHAGSVKVRQDPNDLLSQQLSIMSSLGFAGKADRFVFEWRTCPPHADGTRPDNPDEYVEKARGAGRTSVLVGGEASTMKDLVNTYWICRFKATNETETAWSGWFVPALAEGWLQRCLNNVTPFSQRMTDLYNNAAESTVSMIAQAGPPYLGDVALNGDTLDQVGLIQLYQTLLNRAESLSLTLGPSNTNAQVNKQLLLAAERLHDLYVVLGDEARSDALNPTIGFGTSFAEVDSEVEVDYGACSSALFCFDNQLRSLLDEELALLRGRDGTELPDATEAPVFNRLVWNFTKGITAGEVAYAVNYNIDGGKSTAISANDARAAYPQGHGDAYGHYLSALKGWYRLLRNPNFDWGEPSKGEMSVDGTVVSVDYFEEAKFAEAAAKLAQTAAEVVDRTARKAWRDTGGAPGEGCGDLSDEAFGYGEWAVRGGYGALCNWVVGNALLPGESEGEGLNRIDRGTVGELAEICTAADEIAHRADTADAGLNPLGLSDDAVPFDISPIGADDGSSTHYEQIRARAGVALDNARRTLDRAQQHANRIRMLENAKSAYDSQLAEREEDFNNRLVQIFGRPYAADVGASGTYAQGYAGPDLYHYMWMDLGQYGLTPDDTVSVTELKLSPQGYGVFMDSYEKFVSAYFGGAAGTLTYELSRSGIVVKPAKTDGARRPVNGEIQLAYGEFLAAVVSARAAETRYQEALDSLLNRLAAYEVLVSGSYEEVFTKYGQITDLENNLARYSRNVAVGNATITFVRSVLGTIYQVLLLSKPSGWIFPSLEEEFIKYAGFANGVVQLALESAQIGVSVSNAKSTYADTVTLNKLKAELNRINRENPLKAEQYKYYLEVSVAIDALSERATEATQAFATLVTAGERMSEIIGRGNRILEERAAYRQRAVSKIAKARYNDMLFRQLRNRALSQYASAFDLAQKYAFLAAKAYDYETGLLATDADRGGSFLCEIAAARSLGETRDGVPVVAEAGDGGLASALARMDVNWNTVLKGRLGINNPQRYATWFSLRWENFRIDPGETGEKAWRTELEKHWVEDLRTCPEYARHCQPFLSSGNGLQVKEPGLVIPFSTAIDFAKNLFGQDLMDGDSFFDTAYFCTKIAAAGVWFNGSVQTKTPSVYLFPVGEDRMRAPGQDDGSYVAWNVVDQVIPVPYAIGGGGWSESDWTTWLPSYASGETGTGDSAVRIRRYPSFRAYSGGDGPDDSMLDCPRLVGRSVWNSRWVLIIPAGTLGADREAALRTFVERVKDIRIGFKTYSNSGN